jgi:hypothetical protein
MNVDPGAGEALSKAQIQKRGSESQESSFAAFLEAQDLAGNVGPGARRPGYRARNADLGAKELGTGP